MQFVQKNNKKQFFYIIGQIYKSLKFVLQQFIVTTNE